MQTAWGRRHARRGVRQGRVATSISRSFTFCQCRQASRQNDDASKSGRFRLFRRRFALRRNTPSAPARQIRRAGDGVCNGRKARCLVYYAHKKHGTSVASVEMLPTIWFSLQNPDTTCDMFAWSCLCVSGTFSWGKVRIRSRRNLLLRIFSCRWF